MTRLIHVAGTYVALPGDLCPQQKAAKPAACGQDGRIGWREKCRGRVPENRGIIGDGANYDYQTIRTIDYSYHV